MSYRTDKLMIDGHTDTHTYTHTQATTIPEGQNWPRVKIEIHTFSFNKMPFEMSSVKWWPFCLSLIMLKYWQTDGSQVMVCLMSIQSLRYIFVKALFHTIYHFELLSQGLIVLSDDTRSQGIHSHSNDFFWNILGPLLLTCINFNPIMDKSVIKYGMKLLIHSQTSMDAPLKFRKSM